MIRYTSSPSDVTEDQLVGFFHGWNSPPSPRTMLMVLRGSDHVELAIDNETNRAVGFVTVLTDGVLSAHIPLLEVLPEYQGRGIGSELLRRALARLAHLDAVDLMCDREAQPFYQRLGMAPAFGMMIRRNERQSGGR